MTFIDFAVFAWFAIVAVSLYRFVNDEEEFEKWQKGARRTRR